MLAAPMSVGWSDDLRCRRRRAHHRLERNRAVERRQAALHSGGQPQQVDVGQLAMARRQRQIEQILAASDTVPGQNAWWPLARNLRSPS